MDTILLIGNFGYKKNDLNGQTIKTRVIKDNIQKKLRNTKVDYVDSGGISGIKTLLISIYKAFFASKIIILPGQRAIRFIVPIVSLFKILNKEINYIVIGGWLPEYLGRNKWLIKYLANFKGIYVELNSIVKDLNELGLNNSFYMPNGRKISKKASKNISFKERSNIIFLSRVIKEKGVSDLIKAITEEKVNVVLDIYGPIGEEYKNEFSNLIHNNSKINYKGIVTETEVVDILSKYKLMVFPSYYDGEGFPGVFIDAFMAKTPILASKWKYNDELIKEFKTGFLFEVKNKKDLARKIKKCLEDEENLARISENYEEEMKKYDIDNLLDMIVKDWK